jgi:hypothetical protein
VPDVVSTVHAARQLKTTPPTVRALLARGDLKGRRVPRGSRFAWLVDASSIASYIATHGQFQGGRRSSSDSRMAVLERDVAALRTLIEGDDSPPAALAHLTSERDDLRGVVMSLQDAVARLRAVAELQRQADGERSAVIEHLLAASAASERADTLRRAALKQLEDAVAATAQPAHLGN